MSAGTSTSEKGAVAYPSAIPAARALPTLSLRTNFAWTLLGNLIYAASQWAIIVVLTKCGSPELVGRYALALAIIGPIFTLASLQLRSVQATDAAGEHHFGDYLALRLVMVFVALVAVTALVWGANYRSEVAPVILLLGLARGIEAISDVFLGLFQRHERMDLVARSTILKGTFSAVGFAAGYFLSGALIWGVAGLCVAWTLVLFVFDLRWGRSMTEVGGFTASLRTPSRLVQLGWIALPLALGTVLSSLEISVPRYFIEHQLGEHQLGIFAAMAYLTAIPVQVINALGQSASPRLARLHVGGERRRFLSLLSKLALAGMGIGVAGFLMTLAGGKTMLNFLYTPEYAAQSEVLVWLMAAAGITYSYIFFGTALNAVRVYRPRVPIHLVTLGLLIPTCLLLGSRWGLVGVAWAVCVSQAVAALCYFVVLTHQLKRSFKTTAAEGKGMHCL